MLGTVTATRGTPKSSLELSLKFLAPNSFYKLRVGIEKEKWGAQKAQGRASFSHGPRWGLPLVAQLNGATQNDLPHHQTSVLGQESIRSFLKHETQTKTSLGKRVR